jgi:hypothetical protein
LGDVIDELFVGDGDTFAAGGGVGVGVGVGEDDAGVTVAAGGVEEEGVDEDVSEIMADTIGFAVSSNPSRVGINDDLLSANEMKMTNVKKRIEDDLPIDVPRIRAI